MKVHVPQMASAEAEPSRSSSQSEPTRETRATKRAAAQRSKTSDPGFDFSKIPMHASPRDAGHSSPARRLADALVRPPAPAESGQVFERNVAASEGGALEASRRREFEPRLGLDLSRVRVHTDPAANEASKALGARAFTRGGNIYFAAGRGPSDGRLLAHELAHVAQQAEGCAEALEGLLGNEAARARLEAEADAFASNVGAAHDAGARHARPAPTLTAAPVQLDAEGDLSAALRRRFAVADREGLERQRAQLRAICEAATPAEASALVSRLSEAVTAEARRRDELAEAFHSTLHVAVRRELLDILARRAATPPETTPAAPPATRTVTITGEIEGSSPEAVIFHTPTQRDDSSYIERRLYGAGFGVLSGHTAYFEGPGGVVQEIEVPAEAIDFGARSVENVGGEQIFDNAEQALAAVAAAGGRGGGARPRVAYFRLAGGVVPTLFCPATTPQIIAGWIEAYSRVAEVAGSLSQGVRHLLEIRIENLLNSIPGRICIRLSRVLPVTTREAIDAIARARRRVFGSRRAGAAPRATTTAAPHPPAGAAQPLPAHHATMRARARNTPPPNASEEAEQSQPAPTGEGGGRAPEARMQLGAGGGRAAPVSPRQPSGQQMAGGGGAYRGPAPVPEMDRHPLWTTECQVWGAPQALQAETTTQFVRGAIASGRYRHIIINRSLGRAVGIDNAGTGAPDVILITRNGHVHVVEMQSPGDSPSMYRAQLQRSLRFLYERGITSSGGRVFKLDGSTERYMYDPSIPQVENRLIRVDNN